MKKNKKMYFYESIASEFDSIVKMYDTNKRLEVVYKQLLPEDISGKKLLDAGCGTGWFSGGAAERGASVTSMDLGEGLLNEVKKKCKSKTVVGSIEKMPFPDASFDIVVTSEVIEHIPHQILAFKELSRVLKPGGTLILTTPNKFWYWSVVIANKLNLRPYQGLENWLSWDELTRGLEHVEFKVEKQLGVHALPFTVKSLHPILDMLHAFNKPLAPYMINMAIRCQKKK
ncbi:MAG: hypothetical protein COY80_04335 [Candidatus Pacebacteria bacterium CG_4_10_14_0_8_um_filter_42_14]|nr:MAG: hypothetical protein COY80_04335 [Candidatus Pacebacteria bacterium CG_4_10_14_0_8_um_filter_42_14]